MIIVTEATDCVMCGKAAAVYCDGCGSPLCTECRVFDIWCYGCGHGNTKAFCENCYNNPEINVWLQPTGG